MGTSGRCRANRVYYNLEKTRCQGTVARQKKAHAKDAKKWKAVTEFAKRTNMECDGLPSLLMKHVESFQKRDSCQ